MPVKVSEIINNPLPSKGFGQRDGPSFSGEVLKILEENPQDAFTLREIREQVEENWEGDISMKKMQGTIHNLKRQGKAEARTNKEGKTVWFFARE
jgi:hypothetical protein